MLDVSPTRGNLLRLQDEVAQLHEGHDLLYRKREVLMRELFDMLADAEHIQEEAEEVFRHAHEAIRQARLQMGMDRLHWITLAPGAHVSVKVRERPIMGVVGYLVDLKIETLPSPYGPADTSVAVDEARERWLEVTQLLGELAETVLTAWRLAVELKKTQRRVNALEDIIIPRYESTLERIAAALDEEEREEIVRAKKVKAMH
jgi:V/A-type H+-transporting ATPase subunit D